MRRLEERDRAWLVDLCKRRYPYYDVMSGDAWTTNVVLKNPVQYYATRTSDAWQITNLTTTPWQPTRFQADVVVICADYGKMWQCLTLLRDSIKWARERRARSWRFETETDFDLAPIMKRLGVTELTPRYHMDL